MQADVRRLHGHAAAAGLTSQECGARYEALLRYIFDDCFPSTIVKQNALSYFGSEEIDLAVNNGGAFPGIPSIVLVESKDYAGPVDSRSVGYFLFLCLMKKVELAVIVSANGITGNSDDATYAHSLAHAAVGMGCRLVVVTDADLLSITTPAAFARLLQERVVTAVANGGVGTA